MRMKMFVLLAAVATILSGCATYAVSRYSTSPDTEMALKKLGKMQVNVGEFTSSNPGQTHIVCRGAAPIKTPDGEPFAAFVRKAFVDEIEVAGDYSASAPVTITGKLDNINFSSMSGNWNLALTLNSSNGKSLSQSEKYHFTSSFFGDTACEQTAQALMPAVQDLVQKIVKNPEFESLVK